MVGISPVVERCEPEIRCGTGQPMIGQGGAGEHPATEPRARRAARRFETPALVLVDQIEHVDGPRRIRRRLAQFEWELRQHTVVRREKGPPGPDLGRLVGQIRGVGTLIHAVLAMAGGRYQCRFVIVQRGEVHRLDVEEDHPGRHSIGSQMIDGDQNGESVFALHYAEGEAVPAQRIRGIQQQFADLVRLPRTEILWRQSDHGRVRDDVTVDLVVVTERKPVMVGVMSPHVAVHRVRHRLDIAPALDLPGSDAQPGDIATEADLAPVIPKVLRLLVTHGRRVALRFGGAHICSRGRTPGNDGAIGCPVVNWYPRTCPHPSFVGQQRHPEPQMTLT